MEIYNDDELIKCAEKLQTSCSSFDFCGGCVFYDKSYDECRLETTPSLWGLKKK